ncbi:sodium-independent anion transporter [Azoarcus sp. DD4]|uniref:SulP family inorganic anion transporter n=1 Tax=Azoarcus sp. DD4 TaxID=2027405 RepID=UPI00112AEA47|nr:SulP family inorganic anion transporter [Azoarcus sp. DD4]QDF98606.1 sodium-independent anion transporter [Azoarcus sp. DD4]
MNIQFRPKLLDTLRGYERAAFTHDLSAGITVGVLALPLAMAFAIASGLSPTAGIWTAIVAGFLIAALGGSRVQIGGPTGAFIPIIYAIVADYGVQNLLIATMMSGVMLFAMGAFRLGNMIRFIPLSVVIGFTNGIAVVIFLSQIKDFLGLRIEHLPGEFFGKMKALTAALPTLDLPTVLLAIASLAVLLGWNRQAVRTPWMRRLPGPLAVLILATAVNALLDLPVETIGSRFGGIPQEVPAFGLPELTLGTLGKLIAPALTIALLGAIESLLSARVADSQIDDRHDPNQELMAQGIANVAAPLFGGFAATGAIARTATNIRTGGRTPVAGVIHSVVLLAVVLALAPLASAIPLATLSAIVVIVAVNMGEWHAFAPSELARYSLQYRAILLGTFVVTVVFDLTLAVELGMVLASLFFIYRMSDLTRIERIPLEDHYGVEALSREDGTPRILAYSMFGSLFFGAANKLENLLLMQHGHPDVVILDLAKVINIDTTGLDILQTLHRNLQKRGAHLILCGLNAQPESLVSRSGFQDRLGSGNVTANITDALLRAQWLSGKSPEVSYA